MFRASVLILSLGIVVAAASAEPRVWSDDFMSQATYNSTSLLAPCYGPPGTPSTKYTFFEPAVGDIANQRLVSGGGAVSCINRKAVGLVGRTELIFPGAVNLGQPCPDVAGLPYLQSAETFTSEDICMYGGLLFNPWQMRIPPAHTLDIRGPDGKPGVADRDDDKDGETDEADESPANRPTTVGNEYGNANATGFQAGFDAAPGVVSIDDDANGTTDDVGETCWEGSDDGDDYHNAMWFMLMHVNVTTMTLVYIGIDPVNPNSQFALQGLENYAPHALDLSDEVFYGFYSPNTHYNWVYCASGTCYGALLWTEKDMANPDETIGPVSATQYNIPGSDMWGLWFSHLNDPVPQYFRHLKFVVNSSFNDTFYVISGDARTHFPPITADFDGDKDVDGQDFMKFSKCFNGSLRPPKATCENPEANFDGDIDVDGQDFMAFSKCFNGSLRRPKCLPPILTADCPPPE